MLPADAGGVAFFTEDLKETGQEFDPCMQVLCEGFEKVYP